MNILSLSDSRQATGGSWLGAGMATEPCQQAPLGRVVIDSRQVLAGDVFWALPGRHEHGVKFAAEAIQAGAVGVVTDSKPAAALSGWVLMVDDSVAALQRLAAAQRQRFSGRVVAVTGSVGKTTTRQMIDAVLGSRLNGSASPWNYNNRLGVPLSMLRWKADDDYAVVELGADRPGEIAELAALCAPQIGAITRLGEAHLAGFGGRRPLAQAKGELLQSLPAGGWAVLNGDDPALRRLKPRPHLQVIWHGRSADCDLSASDVCYSQGRLRFGVEGQRLTVPVWGRHLLECALAAVAVGRLWGLAWSDIGDALAAFEPPPMRCQVIGVGGALVINDTYNSSPTAMRAALDLLRDFEAPGQRIVICGDMRELGDEAASLHRELGADVVTRCGADLLVACGDHAADIVAGARAAGMPCRLAIACSDPREAAPIVNGVLRAGDVVLLKGSPLFGA